MPTVRFHHIHLLLIAHVAAQRAAADAARPNALTDDALVAIVMAATAAEAFINELADYMHVLRDAQANWAPISPALVACADVVKEVEDAHGSVTLKYLVASFALTGSTFDKGAQPFQDFAELIKLRNAIVHLKPGDTVGPKRTDALADRGLAQSMTEKYQMPWLDRLLTHETAAWAVRAARSIMLGILAMAPEQYEAGAMDPLAILKQSLRDNTALAQI